MKKPSRTKIIKQLNNHNNELTTIKRTIINSVTYTKFLNFNLKIIYKYVFTITKALLKYFYRKNYIFTKNISCAGITYHVYPKRYGLLFFEN